MARPRTDAGEAGNTLITAFIDGKSFIKYIDARYGGEGTEAVAALFRRFLSEKITRACGLAGCGGDGPAAEIRLRERGGKAMLYSDVLLKKNGAGGDYVDLEFDRDMFFAAAKLLSGARGNDGILSAALPDERFTDYAAFVADNIVRRESSLSTEKREITVCDKAPEYGPDALSANLIKRAVYIAAARGDGSGSIDAKKAGRAEEVTAGQVLNLSVSKAAGEYTSWEVLSLAACVTVLSRS